MLAEIQTTIADYLNGTLDPLPSGLAAVTFFKGDPPSVPAIKVFTEQLADFENEIERQIEALGLCLLILTLTASDSQNNRGAALAYNAIDIRARALCDPALNKTGISCSALAEAAAWFLKFFTPIPGGGTLEHKGIELVEDRSAPLAYDAIFSLSAKSTTAPTRPTPS